VIELCQCISRIEANLRVNDKIDIICNIQAQDEDLELPIDLNAEGNSSHDNKRKWRFGWHHN
jgi:hypothetical protein